MRVWIRRRVSRWAHLGGDRPRPGKIAPGLWSGASSRRSPLVARLAMSAQLLPANYDDSVFALRQAQKPTSACCSDVNQGAAKKPSRSRRDAAHRYREVVADTGSEVRIGGRVRGNQIAESVGASTGEHDCVAQGVIKRQCTIRNSPTTVTDSVNAALLSGFDYWIVASTSASNLLS